MRSSHSWTAKQTVEPRPKGAALDTDHLFPPLSVPEDLAALAKARAWPDDVLQRLVDLRTSRGDLEWMLGPGGPAVEQLERDVADTERLRFGTLRARKADVSDTDQFSELWSSSPEEIDEWEVVVERGPNAFAQWRLQEHVVINVLVDRGLMVACQCNARRNVLVGGRRMTVSFPQGVRVRKEFRRLGYSGLVSGGGGGPHPNSPFDNATYWYVRAQNATAYQWLRAVNPGLFADSAGQQSGMPGPQASILQYPARDVDGDWTAIRAARVADLRRCVTLINRTHRGTDLFRPYTVDFLQHRLDDGSWGPKAAWFPKVYGWEDFYVVEEGGRVVACAGLWDRGRDVREVWRKQDGSAERTIAATALLDFGHAAGREDAMEHLISFLIAQTSRLERTYLMAPLQFLPKVARRLQHLGPVPETRTIGWVTRTEGPDPDPPLTRPYTDLAYW